MTTYSLYTGSGPALAAYSGPIQCGITIQVTKGGMWLNAYRWWVPPGGDTAPQKFALWGITVNSVTGNYLVPGSVVTSGTLTANAWNIITLPAPVQLAPGTQYMPATGWTAVNGFPFTGNQFGSGDPFAAGITNGPLQAFSDGTAGGSPPNVQIIGPQGQFSDTAGQTDPAVWMPTSGSGSANFGMDLVVSDTAPAGYLGPFSLWPNNPNANTSTFADIAVNYIVGTEIDLTVPAGYVCTLGGIRYYSPPTVTQLATRAALWSIASGLEAAALAAPSWSAAAGSGWVQANFTVPPVIASGNYRASVYNGTVAVAAWSSKDASTAYWATGIGKNGISAGPSFAPSLITAPALASASLCYEYSGSTPGSTPPYSNGTQEAGQSPFGQLPSGGNTFPQLYVDGLAQNYWIDALFYLTAASSSAAPPVDYERGGLLRKPWLW